MRLDPAVTATISGEHPKLAAYRAQFEGELTSLISLTAALANRLDVAHEDGAGHYTGDFKRAEQYVASAWRSLGFARDSIEGK
jgi:hypothetical protein